MVKLIKYLETGLNICLEEGSTEWNEIVAKNEKYKLKQEHNKLNTTDESNNATHFDKFGGNYYADDIDQDNFFKTEWDYL